MRNIVRLLGLALGLAFAVSAPAQQPVNAWAASRCRSWSRTTS